MFAKFYCVLVDEINNIEYSYMQDYFSFMFVYNLKFFPLLITIFNYINRLKTTPLLK